MVDWANAGTRLHAVPSTRRTLAVAKAMMASAFAMFASGMLFVLGAAGAHAAPGEPDLSFGPGLIITTLVPGGESYPQAMAMDGNSMVVGGYCYGTNLTSDNVFCVARYLSDGRLDNTFGGAGAVFTRVGIGDSKITAISVQPDRKVIAIGECKVNPNVRAFCVARYNVDGTLDDGFGTSGVAATVFGGTVSEANPTAVKLPGGGKIVVAGTCFTSNRDFCLARYFANGVLDPTFGNGGKVVTPVTAAQDSANALLIQQDGRLLVAGECDLGFCAVRFSADGTIDTTFGTLGKLFFTFGAASHTATSLAQQSDGKLLIGGRCLTGQYRFCIARLLLANGALDNSFGTGGTVLRALGGAGEDSFGNNILVQADQKIVMAGGCLETGVGNADTQPAFCSTRLLSNGQIDVSFGGDGIVKTSRRGSSVEPYRGSAALQSDGKLVQAARCRPAPASEEQFCLVRYHADGALDVTLSGGGSGNLGGVSSIGGSGVVFTPIPGGGEAWSIAVQPDGKTILGGFCSNGSNNDFCLARYLSNGAPDTGFGNSGIVKTPMGSGDDGGSVVLLQRDQKIILAGQCAVSADSNDFCLARYLPSGALDTSFGNGGKVITAVSSGNEGVNSALIQFDGKIVLAGYCINANGNYDFCLARYLSNGTLDTSFNGTGKVVTDVSQSSDFGVTMVQQADGKLLLAGPCFTGNNYDFCVARYRTDGALDTTFGTTNPNTPGPGMISYGIASGDDIARGMAVQPDGKIVIVGDCRGGSFSVFCILRLLDNGALDVPFGDNGTVLDTASTGVAYAVAIQPDGKVLLGGSCDSASGSACAVRYNPDGSQDGTFVNDSNRLSAADTMLAMALLPDGKILQAGTCTHESTKGFCMARYEGGPLNYQNCSLDIDGDGAITPMVDNLIAMRAMRGVTGAGVIGGISFAPHARRTTWGDNSDRDIRHYLRTQCGMTITN